MNDDPRAIFFEGAVVSRTSEGRIAIALFDGSFEGRGNGSSVAVLMCTVDSAGSLTAALTDALATESIG